MKDWALLGNTFINLYSEDNPILNIDDKCYALINNDIDYHRPLIAECLIIFDKITDSQNKLYYVKVLSFLESEKTIDKFVNDKVFQCHILKDVIIAGKKRVQINDLFDFNTNVFPVEAFFIRNSEQKIKQLLVEYVTEIKKDIQQQLNDVDKILESNFYNL